MPVLGKVCVFFEIEIEIEMYDWNAKVSGRAKGLD